MHNHQARLHAYAQLQRLAMVVDFLIGGIAYQFAEM
jgi:hypothetical protein